MRRLYGALVALDDNEAFKDDRFEVGVPGLLEPFVSQIVMSGPRVGVNIGGGCYLGKLNYKQLIVQLVAKLSLPANMINDHLRLQIGVC